MSPRVRHLSIFAFLYLVLGVGTARAQEADEITLLFSFPAVGQVYVSAAFRGEQPLIATGELLSMLMIPFNRTDNRLGYKGAYPTKTDRWEIDPVNNILLRRGERVVLKANQYYLGETDLFIAPELFTDLFGFTLTVNQYALTLSLSSPNILPVEERQKRNEVRERLRKEAPENALIDYPLLYPRKRAFFAPGMLDYNIGMSGGLGNSQLNYTLTGGMELLGGDLQGSISGLRSARINDFRTNGVRWRYVFPGGLDPINNPKISELSIGQLALNGPLGGRVRGIALTNTPIVPRRVLDLFAVEGFTEPDSEIELLIAGQLVDFTRADELGYYRFTTPISYGTVRVGIRIYTPKGEVLFEERQLQIPFTFVPRGMLNYNVQAGFEETFLRDSIGQNIIGHANVAYGLTNSITVRAGADRRLDTLGKNVYLPYGSASIRLFDQYLINVDVLPQSFTRASGSVFYANNTTFNIQYTQYQTQGFRSELTQQQLQRDIAVNYFFSFNVFGRLSGFRAGYEQQWLNTGQLVRFQGDVNTRIGPIISRINYREERITRNGVQLAPQRLLTGSFTYTIPRTAGIPVLVRGMFFRAQVRHDMKEFDASAFGSLQFSQTVWKTGRFTISYDRDFFNRSNIFQLGLLMDFQAFRSSTTSVIRQKGFQLDPNYAQSFSGSFGADLRNGMIIPTNRDQVGRAGVTVRLFVDENNNGSYDKDEKIIPAKAVRLDQSSTMLLGSDGLLRITQLQSYWTYKLIIDVNALPDATLVPTKSKLSFVADPNRFKLIDIPLYKTGTIEGVVYNERVFGKMEPQPGLRLNLKRDGEDEAEVIRTFSDGSFYHYGLMPGNYTLMVDSGQLAFMNVAQHPDTLKFTIRATAEGDWIDTLQIVLRPREPDSIKKDEPLTLAQLERQLGNKLRTAVQAFSEAQELFYRGKFDQAMSMTDSSLREYTTDFAIAMKGSIAFMQGDKQAAANLWAAASERNPFVALPDTNKIRLKVRTLLPDSLAAVPKPAGPADTIAPIPDGLLAELEAGLGEQLRQSVSFFTESQELFYRLRFDDALSSIDSSLSYYVSDHALALKGSIVYILGRKTEAWQYWYEAQARNPMIVLPNTEVLDRLTTPIAEAPERNARKRLISNTN